MRLAPLILAAIATGAYAAATLPAQTIRRVLLDDKTERPIDQASVLLLDAHGVRQASAITDSAGNFVLRASRAGSYVLWARRIGYKQDTSPPIELKADQVLEMDFLIAARPT